MNTAQLIAAARRLHQQGRLSDAAALYRAVLAQQADHPDALYLLGLIHYRQGHTEEAMQLIEQAIRHQPGHALANASLGQIYQDLGEHRRAVELFQRAVQLNPENSAPYNGLGLSLLKLGELDRAQDCLEQAIVLNPGMAAAHNNLGNVLRARGEIDEARECYHRCLACEPTFAEAHNNLGVLYQQQQAPSLALKCFKTAVDLNPGNVEAWNNLGAALNDLGKHRQALKAYRRTQGAAGVFVPALINMGCCLHTLGEYQQASDVLDQALLHAPGNLTARWVRCVTELKAVYVDEPEIAQARAAYGERLSSLVDSIREVSPDRSLDSAELVGVVQPFLLPYQGYNDRELQTLYGDLLCTLGEPGAQKDQGKRRPGRFRVGIVSAFFYDHSNWKIPIRGWIKALAQRFELGLYHTGYKQDLCTEWAEQNADYLYTGLSAEQFKRQILEDQPDILIYPELGMHPLTLWLGAQRLAPVQCVSWGHPVTSGLPTMDYFISSEWMEPADAQLQYRERLLVLPGLSFGWSPPGEAEQLEVDRGFFGLNAQDCNYLCVQNLSKYLPQHDRLLARIAAAVDSARLVFIRGPQAVTERFEARLRNCFEREGVDYARHVVFLDRLDRDRYRALNQVADVSLDTFGWSGCNSTLEALWCDLPVVTLPGRWMRGRHSKAIYQQLGYTRLVAETEDQYVSLAVRLGNDRGWREQQRDEIAQRKAVLVDDDRPARVLAEKLEQIAARQANR